MTEMYKKIDAMCKNKECMDVRQAVGKSPTPRKTALALMSAYGEDTVREWLMIQSVYELPEVGLDDDAGAPERAKPAPLRIADNLTGRVTPEETVRAAMADYMAGHGQRDVALKYGVSQPTVRRWAEKSGVLREKIQFSAHEMEHMAQEYRDGLPFTQIADRWGIKPARAMSIIRRWEASHDKS